MSQPVAKLVSVNVGRPREITWRGRTVFTGIWKEAVDGPRTVGRLNVEGDGQGDLEGHGGEQRAVFVYQLESYRYWQTELQRDDFTFGQFGENFTVDGLGDDDVCVGDRYRIGSAVFEVTQPRVTCYRVGIRMDEPRMPALLVAHGRPGFYFRVLETGEVRAGDDVVKLMTGPEAMTIADINALLYLAGRHDVDAAPARPAHPGAEPGLAGLAASAPRGGAHRFGRPRQRGTDGAGTAAGLARIPDAPSRGEAPGEHRRRVTRVGIRGRSSPPRAPQPGQFVTLKLRPDPGLATTRTQLFALRPAGRGPVPDQREGGTARRRRPPHPRRMSTSAIGSRSERRVGSSHWTMVIAPSCSSAPESA